MSISRNSLYYKTKLSAKDLLLKGQIESVLLEHRAYCYRRIAIALIVNPKRVRRVMKLFGIKAKADLIEAIAIQIHYYNHKRIHSAIKMPPKINPAIDHSEIQNYE